MQRVISENRMLASQSQDGFILQILHSQSMSDCQRLLVFYQRETIKEFSLTSTSCSLIRTSKLLLFQNPKVAQSLS